MRKFKRGISLKLNKDLLYFLKRNRKNKIKRQGDGKGFSKN